MAAAHNFKEEHVDKTNPQILFGSRCGAFDHELHQQMEKLHVRVTASKKTRKQFQHFHQLIGLTFYRRWWNREQPRWAAGNRLHSLLHFSELTNWFYCEVLLYGKLFAPCAAWWQIDHYESFIKKNVSLFGCAMNRYTSFSFVLKKSFNSCSMGVCCPQISGTFSIIPHLLIWVMSKHGCCQICQDWYSILTLPTLKDEMLRKKRRYLNIYTGQSVHLSQGALLRLWQHLSG